MAHGARHAALLHELGFSDACIMINQVEAPGFGFNAASESTLGSFASLLAGSDTRLTLTSWLRPDKIFIDDLVRMLPPLARDIGARAIESMSRAPGGGGVSEDSRTTPKPPNTSTTHFGAQAAAWKSQSHVK